MREKDFDHMFNVLYFDSRTEHDIEGLKTRLEKMGDVEVLHQPTENLLNPELKRNNVDVVVLEDQPDNDVDTLISDSFRNYPRAPHVVISNKPLTIQKYKNLIARGLLITLEPKRPEQLATLLSHLLKELGRRKSCARIRNVLDDVTQISKVGGWECHLASRKTIWTKPLRTILELPANYNTDEAPVVDFIAEADRAAFEQEMARLAEGPGTYEGEMTMMAFSGKEKRVRIRMRSLKGATAIERVVGTALDITQRTQLEKQLEKQVNDLEKIVEKRTSLYVKLASDQLQKAEEFESSLRYAKRIQMSVLPSKAELNAHVQNHFVLYLPKDIVSGDFYWSARVGDTSVFALADCTGHGVPAALLSILGAEKLKKIIEENKIVEPSKVLERLDHRFETTVKRKGKEFDIDDGMEISIVTIDREKSLFRYAGARSRGLLVSPKGAIQLQPDRFGIGGMNSPVPKNWVTQDYEIVPGSMVYLYSDGFQDQFGGPLNKKFSRRNLEGVLRDIWREPLNLQRETLLALFKDWKGNHMQLDDVSVIGIRL